MAPHRNALDHARGHEIGKQAGANERRLAGTAGTENQHEAGLVGGPAHQGFGDLALRALAPEEHSRMGEVECL